MNYKSFFLFLISLTALNAGLGLQVQLSDVKSSALPGEELMFSLRLYNNGLSTINVYINKFAIDSAFGTASVIDPSHNVQLSPGEEKTATISIPVIETLMRGVYIVPLYISYDDNTDWVELRATVLEKEAVAVLTNLAFNAPSIIDPRIAFNLNGSVTSSKESYPVLTIMVSNDQGIVYDHSSIQQLNSGLNYFNRTVKFSSKMVSGNYTLVVQFSFDSRVGAQSGMIIRIPSVSSLINDKLISDSFFGRSVITSVFNNGTNIEEVTVSKSLSIIESLFATNIELIVKENGEVISVHEPVVSGGVASGSLTINPGQSAELIIRLTYLPLIIVPFIVVVVILSWLFLTKKVTVEKNVIEVYTEQGTVYVKVNIKVKNVSLKKLSNVRVIETVPVYVKGVGEFGSIKGAVNKKSRTITWTSEMIKPKEEVLISYKFKTGVELIGTIMLPPALVKYTTKRRVHQAKSNTPVFYVKGRTK